MRSLSLLDHSCVSLEHIPSSEGRSFIVHDPETSTIYAAFEDNEATIHIMATGLSPVDPLAFSLLGHIPYDPKQSPLGAIVDFTFLSDLQVACLVTREGDIILVSKERFERGEEVLENVGTVDAGVHAMTWSPDQDLVILVTGEKNVLVMTQDFDTITEYPLHVQEQGEGVQQSVGWGKKETQFHGSAGKEAALQKVDASKFSLSEDDDQRPRIAWRGDGSLFTISDIDPLKDARVIRIYNREGVLQNTSEPVDCLEHVLDWRPSGNLIVSSQRLPHRHDIVFLEKNGLRHGEFTLRETTQHRLLQVSWNADSSVLAVWIEALVPATGKMQKSVQFWTSGNYYWYMKQSIVLAQGADVVGFAWDVESPLRAYVVSSLGHYHCLNYAWDILGSTSVEEDNAGYIAVMDGASVLLTPFSHQNIPPPMCALKQPTSGNVRHVSFGPNSAGTQMAVLTTERIQLFELPANARGPVTTFASLLFPSVDANTSSYGHSPIRHLQWMEERQLAYLQYNEEKAVDMLCIATFVAEDENSLTVVATSMETRIGRLYYNVSNKDLMVQNITGTVYEVHLHEDHKATLQEVQQFPDFCPWMATTCLGTKETNVERIVIGLTERSKLYANDRLLSAKCTSFSLRSDWLVFSTTSHAARFLPLSVSFDDFKLSDNTPDANDESYRRLERGAKIVAATQLKPNLILQMPRGNLETISPRAFVLAAICEDIKNVNYRSAFIACRRNRIDLNILFDENPQQFFDAIERFVEQVSEVDYLNLFLSNLRNEDTTLTMYRKSNRTVVTEKETGLEKKVNSICEAVRNVLLKLSRKDYIQSILSTYVRSSPPDLESALILLAEIKETSTTEAEDALKYTIFLCDADSLYDVALGMYNFSLVLMVAQQAQKDPREYLPFLQELHNLEKYYQRFRIDDYLKRYEKALKNLSCTGDDRFQELVEYMRKHSLYLPALSVYANRPPQKQIILNVYGEYLTQSNAYSEAGIVYTMANNLEKALQAYCMDGSWRECFSLAKQMKHSNEYLHDLAYNLIEFMKEKRRFQEAATIANDYAKDVEEAVDCLLKGSLWQEAARVAHTYDRADLIETHVKPGLIEGYSQTDEEMDDMTAQFNKQRLRLKELREIKPEPTVAMPNDDSLDNVDMFSDTTSMYSQFTRYTKASSCVSTISSVGSNKTRKTSKLRKREERKRARGKKGTVFEEEYIVNSLKRLCEKANSMQNDLHNLLRALAPFGYVEEARTIQNKFEHFLKEMVDAIPSIFVPLHLATSQFASQEEVEESTAPVQIDKPVMTDIQWKLQIL
ncbi:IKI3 family-domain-containing protein [Spinellus fusiger]|nr:IKI3 family-domain-containing protein [Spinellus fusiger]